MKVSRSAVSLGLLAATLAGCGDGSGGGAPIEADPCAGLAPEERTSVCSEPKQTAAYYAEQSSLYFDTLDSYVPIDVIPNYSPLVARWEWPPWLKLTAFGREAMIFTDIVLKLFPTTIPDRDCRGFDAQPFGRCHVNFDYSGDRCPIYEEFTFNDAGEITFIEAWSDFPPYLPMEVADRWGEGGDVNRLSAKIPGLGAEDGLIDVRGEAMAEAAAADPDVADFVVHAEDPFISWLIDSFNADPDSFEKGCNPGAARLIGRPGTAR